MSAFYRPQRLHFGPGRWGVQKVCIAVANSMPDGVMNPGVGIWDGVQGSGFRVQGLGFRVQGLGFRV